MLPVAGISGTLSQVHLRRSSAPSMLVSPQLCTHQPMLLPLSPPIAALREHVGAGHCARKDRLHKPSSSSPRQSMVQLTRVPLPSGTMTGVNSLSGLHLLPLPLPLPSPPAHVPPPPSPPQATCCTTHSPPPYFPSSGAHPVAPLKSIIRLKSLPTLPQQHEQSNVIRHPLHHRHNSAAAAPPACMLVNQHNSAAACRARMQSHAATNHSAHSVLFSSIKPHHDSQALSLFRQQHPAPSDGRWRCARWRRRWLLSAKRLQQWSGAKRVNAGIGEGRQGELQWR